MFTEMLSWLLPLLVLLAAVISGIHVLLGVLTQRLRCRRRRRHTPSTMTSADTSQEACLLLCCRPSTRSKHVIDSYQQSVRANQQHTAQSSANNSRPRQQHQQQQQQGIYAVSGKRRVYTLQYLSNNFM